MQLTSGSLNRFRDIQAQTKQTGIKVFSDVIGSIVVQFALIQFGRYFEKSREQHNFFVGVLVIDFLYPDLQKALPLIIQKASDVQAKPPKKKLSYSLPLGTIEKYVSFEEVINPSKSKGLFFAIADNGNHFTKYGIQEGSLMVFDRESGQAEDFPCCYIDETSKKMKLLHTAGESDQYVGRLVAVLNTFQA